MLQRVLEPEVMDTPEEAVAYDSMDHSVVNALFADQLVADLLVYRQQASLDGVQRTLTLLDVGTGTAQIPIEICRRDPEVRIVALDLAEQMLALGRRNVERAGLVGRIDLRCVDAKRLDWADGEFVSVVSNSIVHHIPEPLAAFREMARVLRPGGVLFVRDLLRPATLAERDALVDLYASGATPQQRQLFADSLHAALTLDEVRQLSQAVGWPAEWARQTSDRHWTIRSHEVPVG